MGKHYFDVDSGTGRVTPYDVLDYKGEIGVYNQLAPVIETRCAKLRQLNKSMTVLSLTPEDDDVKNAEIATEVLKSTYKNINMDEKLFRAIDIMEKYGSAFFISEWDVSAGRAVGEKDGRVIFEGDVNVTVCTPLEIFPADYAKNEISEQEWIIHARVMSVSEIYNVYGVQVTGDKSKAFDLFGGDDGVFGGVDYSDRDILQSHRSTDVDAAVVITYYERPSGVHRYGRLIIIAGESLLYSGKLPYENALGGGRKIPIVKIDCISSNESFFGGTVLDRLIPVQKNYNAVLNKIYEYLSRTAIGIPIFEEGMIENQGDILDYGLVPGTPVIKKPGAADPHFMEMNNLPEEFFKMLSDIQSQFNWISGVSEMARVSSLPGSSVSGIAAQMVNQQDDTRLGLTGKNVIIGIRELGRQWLCLYRQFAVADRLVSYTGISYSVVKRWNRDNINSFNIEVCEDTDMFEDPAQNRELLNSLMQGGLIGQDSFSRIMYLSSLKNGDINKQFQEEQLDIKNAEEENYRFRDEADYAPVVREEDNHELHLRVHRIFMKGDWFRGVCYGTRAEDVRRAEVMREHLGMHASQLTINN
jgi:hypothetical protein